MNPIARRPRGLYLLTPDDDDTARLVARTAAALAGGPTWLQYRNKTAEQALRREQVAALLPLCRAHGVPLIVNDDWSLAAELGADGAHLGRDDGALAPARAALGPGAILGASCYDEPARAVAAIRAGASYVAFGAFFPSPTKPGARAAPLSLLHDHAGGDVPVVAIGGITPDNAPIVIAAGTDLVAAVSGVFAAADPAAAVRAYRRAFDTPATESHP
jgi:thiamine-phosphate pyrophosphorylase